VGRFQSNPSIGWVDKKSTHAHPFAWGNNKCCFASQLPTFSVDYIQWELNFGQNHLWHKIEVLLGILIGITWGTSREHDENMLRTHWEQGRKTNFNAPKGFILFCTWNHLIAYFFYSNQNLLYFRLGECLLLGTFSLDFVLEEWGSLPPTKPTNFPITHTYWWVKVSLRLL